MAWSFDRILARTERAVDPGDQAVIHGDHILTWGALTARSNSLAAGLLAHGAAPGDKVAHYLRNGPEYIETSAACFKTGMVHVNVNYRYTANELFYLFDNADAAVIVYDRDFAPRIAELRERLPKVKLFIEAGGVAPLNGFALPYESLAAGAYHFVPPAMPDDPLLFIYTGGTTGMPKGVMWRHEDLWAALGGVNVDLDVFEADLRAGKRGTRALICPPLMHGAGYMIALLHLLRGGTVMMAAGAGFDAQAVLGMIDAHRPLMMLIVGDAFGRPLADALAAPAREYDLSSLQAVVSSGAGCALSGRAGLQRGGGAGRECARGRDRRGDAVQSRCDDAGDCR
jgi:fatty-acyl-CoA synthase